MNRDLVKEIVHFKNLAPTLVVSKDTSNHSVYARYVPKDFIFDEVNDEFIDKLKFIYENNQSKTVEFENGDVLKVDTRTAKNILEVYDSLNSDNKKRVKELIEQDKIGFKKMADFAWKHIKNN